MNDIEEEAILLKAVTELVDSMVNRQLFELLGSDPDCNVLFHTNLHQKFFNIVLADFLSKTDKKASVRSTSYLGALKAITDAPHLSSSDSAELLKSSTTAFIDWLNQEVEVDAWMPSIDRQVKLKLSRLSFLKMCGHISKHNFLRSLGVAEELQETLAKAGVLVTRDDALSALTDFYDRFHNDILNYHASTITEFLNDIRWGIYHYLQPEFQRSIVWESKDPPMYRYTLPTGISENFAKGCYWELMNDVRSPPYIPRFKVTKWLKLRY